MTAQTGRGADLSRHDADSLGELARAALASGQEQAALPLVSAGAESWRNARLWQWAGLLHRSLDEHSQAIDCFAEAARLAPADAGIAHGRARVALEAGLDAVGLYEQAAALAPGDGAVRLGLAAARLAAGEGERAANELDELVQRAPGWTEGFEQLAQLLSMLGRRDQATEPLERALTRFPRQESLWTTLFGVRLKSENFAALREDVTRAEAARVAPTTLARFGAIAAGELDDETFPAALFGDGSSESELLGIWQIRHLLRVGAIEEALATIDRELQSARAADTWPYASLAWRIAGDARSEWLEGDPKLVSIADLTPDLPPLETLTASLRALHRARGEYLDQSVRGGTQTDGPLLSRIDPVIRQLRGAIIAAVERYVERLPPIDERHPLLGRSRNRRVRFSGSWSVRLRPGGRHSNHVHPQGWISSALYIALPPKSAGEREDAGWLALGEPQQSLGLDLEPRRKIEPKLGQLVLFPSWMWHGTVPFDSGERLTVAFDVAPS